VVRLKARAHIGRPAKESFVSVAVTSKDRALFADPHAHRILPARCRLIGDLQRPPLHPSLPPTLLFFRVFPRISNFVPRKRDARPPNIFDANPRGARAARARKFPDYRINALGSFLIPTKAAGIQRRPATKGHRQGVSRRVKWRNESDRMAQDAMVGVRRSPSRIARDSNLIRISS